MSARTARLAALFILYGSLSSPAYAYIDPATGSIIIQAVIGAVGTALIYYRNSVSRVKAFFAGLMNWRSRGARK